MKEFIKKVVLFLLFLAVIYPVGVICWEEFKPFKKIKKNLQYIQGAYGHTYSRLSEVDTIQNIDLLFLGSSHAYRGFDNRYFERVGITSFNLGSSSQSSVQSNYLLKRYLKQLNPKQVIIEVYPLTTFGLDGSESCPGFDFEWSG